MKTVEFTSGVEIGEDGTLRHVPARVITIDGKTYVAIYSRTNGINCLINKKAGFNDMTGHWAQETVSDMVSRLIISGTGNSTFLPDEEITRAEFIAIVIRALGLQTSDSVTIADVDPGKWYYDVIAVAYSNGLVSGDTNEHVRDGRQHNPSGSDGNCLQSNGSMDVIPRLRTGSNHGVIRIAMPINSKTGQRTAPLSSLKTELSQAQTARSDQPSKSVAQKARRYESGSCLRKLAG